MSTFKYYRAYANEHPFTREMLGELNQFGVEGLLNPDNDLKRQTRSNNDFAGYGPTQYVSPIYPKTEFDFSYSGTYSIYNWELFFHTVTLITRQLRFNNKFAESVRWLNYVFDPTAADNPAPDQLYDLRYWQIKPFMQNVSNSSIRNIMRLLSSAPTSPAEVKLKQEYQAQIALWRANPFDPHIIASMRPRTYMLWTVMEYVTTLTDWGDYLFRQDTMESINEAINLYVLASEILGPKPKKVSRPESANTNFNSIISGLSAFSNLMVAFENNTPAIQPCVTCDTGITAELNQNCNHPPALSTVTDLLFCIPDNPKLTDMWNRVEDRLFKIRHCMNIDGKVRSLALFSPPIDPALLVQATAGGLSIEDALSDMIAPLPHYRFSHLIQKANEFCNEVKSMGSQLLSLMEKKDSEALSLFRQVHEQNILKASKSIKQLAIDEAKQNLATLESSKILIEIRLADYKDRKFINEKEKTAIDQNNNADIFFEDEQNERLMAGIFGLIPNGTLGISGAASSPVFTLTFGGSFLSSVTNIKATNSGGKASKSRNRATAASTNATFQRRQEDWNLQIKSATEELAQVDRQILSAQIKINSAEKELENHELQVAQSDEMYQWMKNKYTNGQLYSWMMGQVRTVYKQSFNLAFSMAKMAQRCLNYELGANANFILHGQWEGARAGLLAGERLSLQIKQLDNFYIEKNERLLELTKNVSIALLNPQAIQDLIVTGSCEFILPELLFDLDHPGHYLRRIKTVSISIPCIAGPQTNINARLSLVMDARRDSTASGNYPMALNNVQPVESIATSSAQNDSGVFELSFKDERYLPFEGRGAVSKWRLDLTQIERGTPGSRTESIRLFDFKTIADVVLHIKYTAKDDGVLAAYKKGRINTDLTTLANAINSNGGMLHAYSLRHDMPNEWHKFKSDGNVTLKLPDTRLPYFAQVLNPAIDDLTIITQTSRTLPAASSGDITFTVLPATPSLVTLTKYTDSNMYHETISPAGFDFGDEIKIEEGSLKANEMDDLIFIVKLNVS